MSGVEFNVESPWGNFQGEGMLDWIAQCWHQLQYFKKKQEPNVTEHLKRDIEGYEAVLNTGLEVNAHNFMKLKHEAKDAGARFADNMVIVEEMKRRGLWRD